jgi:hypothetical protein
LFTDFVAFDRDQGWLVTSNLFNQLCDIPSSGEGHDAKLLRTEGFQDAKRIASNRTGRTQDGYATC